MTIPADKVINIQHSNNEVVQIMIPADKAKELTCYWLLQQAISKLKEKFPQEVNFDDIVTLCTVTRDYAVDHWLTFHYRNLSVLKSGTTLKPFYKQKSEEAKSLADDDFKKVTLDDFIVEIKLGYGAFSKVFLGKKLLVMGLLTDLILFSEEKRHWITLCAQADPQKGPERQEKENDSQ